MLTIYLMICSFVLGGYVAAAFERKESLPWAIWIMIVFISLAWPLIPILAVCALASKRTKL